MISNKYYCKDSSDDFVKSIILNNNIDSIIIIRGFMADANSASDDDEQNTTIHLSPADAAEFARGILEQCTDLLLNIEEK